MPTPPIVGVPAFTWWPSGTSSWIGWPMPVPRQPVDEEAGAEERHGERQPAGEEEGDHLPRAAPRPGRPLLADDLAVVERHARGRRWPGWSRGPCPAITTTSPGCGRGQRRGDGARAGRARRAGWSSGPMPVEHGLDDRSRVLGAGVVGGDDDEVGALRRRPSPMSGRFDGSRSPPQPNTTRTRPPPASSPGRGEHLVEPVGRVGVVDDDGERLAGVDELEAARHRATRRPGPSR